MSSGRSSIFSGTDIQFILTFAAGMGAFWLSGRLPGLIPANVLPHNNLAVTIIGIVAALIIYGLGMAVWSWLVLGRSRALKPVLGATGIAVILAFITSLVLTFTNLGNVSTTGQLAVLAFVLYVIYGAYYVAGWAFARKLAK